MKTLINEGESWDKSESCDESEVFLHWRTEQLIWKVLCKASEGVGIGIWEGFFLM